MPAPWIYTSGETVLIGDIVFLGHWPGVVVDLVGSTHPDWNEATGEGVLFEGPDFGRLFADTLGPDVRWVRRGDSCGATRT
ncbi:MAG: hypothetical protein RLZZ34_203 [Verrucomicrobiota bacterium]